MELPVRRSGRWGRIDCLVRMVSRSRRGAIGAGGGVGSALVIVVVAFGREGFVSVDVGSSSGSCSSFGSWASASGAAASAAIVVRTNAAFFIACLQSGSLHSASRVPAAKLTLLLPHPGRDLGRNVEVDARRGWCHYAVLRPERHARGTR